MENSIKSGPEKTHLTIKEWKTQPMLVVPMQAIELHRRLTQSLKEASCNATVQEQSNLGLLPVSA